MSSSNPYWEIYTYLVSLPIFYIPVKKLLLALLILSGFQHMAWSAPQVQFTVVPDWATTSLLEGKVHNTTLNDHGLAVYIYIAEAGGWWTKPTSSEPVTHIRADSGFSTNIVTGGMDQYATQIIAFLIPLSFSPPVLLGEDLPASMLAFPYATVCRPHGSRTLSWSGFEWTVKTSVGANLIPLGPGPNIFSDNDTMVWVDNLQRLHLRIAKHGNDWLCTELICKSSLGYDHYSFDIDGRVDLLDPNVIAGIFTWDDCSLMDKPPNNYFREIDFEFSRWGDPLNKNSQFVVQPYDITGNRNRFNMNLAGISHSVHGFTWYSDSIVFKSSWGSSSYAWKYTNQTYIPAPGNENVRINLWLYYGRPPTDARNAELILNSFITNIEEPGSAGDQIRIFPNPVEQGCRIEIQSDRAKDMDICIIDLRGCVIRKVYSGRLTAGSNTIEWDGLTTQSQSAQPGFYLVCLSNKFETRYLKIIRL